MATTSLRGVLVVFRTRLMTFEPLDGSDPLGRRLSGGLNLVTVPDAAAKPYGAIRPINIVRTGRTHLLLVSFNLEALWFHEPRAKALELEDVADVADQALLAEGGWHYTDADGGWLRIVGAQRDTMRATRSTEADQELVQVRQLFETRAGLAVLTQYEAVA